MSNFSILYKASRVKRWHTQQTIKEQNLAHHQWGVALIIMEILPGSYNALRAALTHDLAESVTGDIPYFAKRSFPMLGKEADKEERKFNIRHDIHTYLTEEEQACLRWADMAEAFLFACEEVDMGNTTFYDIVEAAGDILNDTIPPNERASRLLVEILSEH